jgi:hypothetical protein
MRAMVGLGLTMCVIGTLSCTDDASEPAASSAPPTTAEAEAVELDRDEVIGTWMDPAGEPVVRNPRALVFHLGPGPEHCVWQDALFLHLAVPFGKPAPDFADVEQYIRDPDGVVNVDASLRGNLDLNAELPKSAEFTGFTTEHIQLWIEADHSGVFLTDGHAVERWPRVDPRAGCI